jgi:hypothetical protein
MEKSVPVAWRDHPFAGQVHRTVRPEGVTILEIVDSIPNLPAHFAERGEVCINGERVPRHMWPYARPRVDRREVVVTLHCAPGNAKTLELVASVAVLVAAVAVSGGALSFLGPAFAAGSYGAVIAASVTPITGCLSIGGV